MPDPIDSEEKSVDTKLFYLRSKLAKRIYQVQELEKQVDAPAVQELVLARRHLEDARMRVGVAMAHLKGQDPWASGFNVKKEEESTNE